MILFLTSGRDNKKIDVFILKLHEQLGVWRVVVKQDLAPGLVLPDVPLSVQLCPDDLLGEGDPAEAAHRVNLQRTHPRTALSSLCCTG